MFDLDLKPIAHRGYFNDAIVENTLEAFDNAVKHNFDIELDVQLTKDLELVIAHDLHLKRIAGVDKRIKDLTYNELRNIKLRGKDAYIPKFKDVLDLVDGKSLLVIELKSIDKKLNPILVDKTLELLKDYKGKYVVQSFDPLIMRLVRLKNPKIIRGQLVTGHYDNMPKIISYMVSHMWTNIFSKPDYLNTDINSTNRVIKKYLKQGKPVISYTAKTKEEYIKYLNIYDNVIFQDFDPTKIFHEQINLKK